MEQDEFLNSIMVSLQQIALAQARMLDVLNEIVEIMDKTAKKPGFRERFH